MRLEKKATVAVLAVLLMMALACGQTGATESPASPPTEGSADTPGETHEADGAPEPTREPETTVGWSSHASTKSEMSYMHPGTWFGPAELADRNGAYLKDPDADIGMIMRWKLSGDPADLLAAWGTEDITVPGAVEVPMQDFVIEDGDPVTVSRITAATRIGTDGAMTAQTVFIQRYADVLQIEWFAPADRWEEVRETFLKVLASIELWHKHVDKDLGLQMIYLHDWADPEAPWEGDGLWFHSADDQSGVVIWVRPVGEPQDMLAEWSPDALSGLGFSDCTMALAEKEDRISTFGAQWESQTGQCTSSSGAGMTYTAAYALNRDRLLEIVAYGPTDNWEYAYMIASRTMSFLMDIR